jgi:hypothetical protein
MNQKVHPLFIEQMQAVTNRFPGSTLQALQYGDHLLCVPDIGLPKGWSPRTVTLLLYLPPGYPFATPANFWTQEVVRVANGGWDSPLAQPHCSNSLNRIPGFRTVRVGTWFSWVPQHWTGRETLLTWLHTVLRRFHAEPIIQGDTDALHNHEESS